jgi:hypothetical protein
MIGFAQTQSCEITRACLSRSGKANVRCPFCDKRHYTSVPEHLHNKPVRAKCECGKSFPVLFDSRGYYRKEVRLKGEYWNAFGEKDLMTVMSLSLTGAGLSTGRSKPIVTMGETVQLRFLLDDKHSTWIKVKAIVKRVVGDQLGVEFVGLQRHEQKCLGFYLMP